MKTLLNRLGILVAAAVGVSAVIYACGNAAGPIGVAMRDAGDAIRDMGTSMAPDASATPLPTPSEVFTVIVDPDTWTGETVSCEGSAEPLMIRGPVLITHISDMVEVHLVQADGSGPCTSVGRFAVDSVRTGVGLELYIDANHAIVLNSGGTHFISGRRL